ncbi:MAG: hypothetical protein USCAAHI_02371 [Beijerinckiaceae bacterium]|jgi:hypothetical protein|nr:MAG: hypothetical protein USCAAHI_02371 [Beijerinckiaceae bacterium]
MAETKDGVSLAEMAGILDMDESQVLRLARKGVVVRVGPGRYASGRSETTCGTFAPLGRPGRRATQAA